MKNFVGFWRAEIERKTAVLLVGIIWLINATMNAAMGFETGDESWLYALVFFSFAGLGAWAMCEQAHVSGLKRAACLMLVVVQLVIGQLAGWQQFGLTLERGAGRLDAKATKRETIDDSYAGLKAERAAILARRPQLRPVDAVTAERDLECSITSRRYPDGRGPKCTSLESELADMKRLAVIRAKLPEIASAKNAGPQIRNSDAHIKAPAYFSNALQLWWNRDGEAAAPIGPEDVRFGLMVFFTAALELGATLGFWLVGVGKLPPAGRSDGGMAPANDDPAPAGALTPSSDRHLRAGQPVDVLPASRRIEGPPARDALAAPASSHAHGAPVNVVIHGWGQPEHAGGAVPGAAAAQQEKLQAPSAARRARAARADLDPLPGDAPPVDRQRLQREFSDEERVHVDVLAAFAAACIVDAPGGVVSGRDLYRRYAQWAGGRAVTEEAFFGLFPDVTGVRVTQLAGIAHAEGVALRAAQPLEVVA